MQNGISIYPMVIDNYYLRLVIETNGKKVIGEMVYKNWAAKINKGDIKWGDVVQRLYTYKFLKLGGESYKQHELELEVFLVKLKRK